MNEVFVYARAALYILYVLAIIGSVVSIILENRNPLKTIAWIIVLTFVPVIGLLAYLALGQKWYKHRIVGKRSYKKVAQSPQAAGLAKTMADFPGGYARLAKLFMRTEGGYAFPGNKTVAYFNGADFAAALLREIAGAKHHIHIEYYIFMDDAFGNLVADALIDKARQGVIVRVIVDDVGSWKAKERFFNKMRRNGIEVAKFMPVRFRIQSKINYRNHRKLTVIDGDKGFIGGMNIADRYVKGVKWGKWRDTQIFINGYAAHQLQMTFIGDWFFATKRNILAPGYFPQCSTDGTEAIQIATSAPFDRWRKIMQGFMLAITRAKDYVYIETPYFMPTEPVMETMQTAALSGIDIRLIIPSRSDSLLTQLATRSYLKDMLRAGVKVYMYKEGFIHSKMLVCDDMLSVIGSSNIDFRSFEQNFESNAFIYGRELAATMKKQFQIDQAQSVRVTIQAWKHRPTHIRVKESLIRIFSPLL